MSFFKSLQRATLGGVPFGVKANEGQFGRRVQLHQYFGRDIPWAEDLGRGARRFEVVGFLLENDRVTGGGDVISQYKALIKVVEAPGPLTLVHPTLGMLQVAVPENGLRVIERDTEGQCLEISISCIEAGKRVSPSSAVSTGSAVSAASTSANAAIGKSFIGRVSALFPVGQSVIAQAIYTAQLWIAMALALGSDAAAIYHMTAELPGNNGRFYGGAINGFLANAAPAVGATPTIAGLVEQGAANLAAIQVAAQSLGDAAASGSPASIVAGAQSVAAAVLGATVNPADTIRLLAGLAGFTPTGFTTADAVGQAMAGTQAAMGNLFRRSAVVALANASATYQPSSADDAIGIRNRVTGLIDNEIEIAGDNFEDGALSALRTLRQAVVTDLNTRGAALPSLRTFAFGAQLPAAVLALRIYRDAGRADQLVTEAAPAHPSFMPTSFQALSR